MIHGVLKVNIQQLNLALTLKTGQNFRWKLQTDSLGNTRWLGILKNLFVISLLQHDDRIEYELVNVEHVLDCLKISSNDPKSLEKFRIDFQKILNDYFRLDIDLEHLYSHWSHCDKTFGKISYKYPGIRLLRQDTVENIFSFICSSNNNISRISKMIETLCQQYGNVLYQSKNVSMNNVYSFPTIASLANKQVEQNLRKFGFGSKFIHETAKFIMNDSDNRPDEWIEKLKKLTYTDAKRTLMSLPGVGAKVADCICLMSLGFTEAIPVDTHVYQITAKHYLPELNAKYKTLTNKRYNEIGNFYRKTFQIHSGWAQTVLFCSDLKILNNDNNSCDKSKLRNKKK